MELIEIKKYDNSLMLIKYSVGWWFFKRIKTDYIFHRRGGWYFLRNGDAVHPWYDKCIDVVVVKLQKGEIFKLFQNGNTILHSRPI